MKMLAILAGVAAVALVVVLVKFLRLLLPSLRERRRRREYLSLVAQGRWPDERRRREVDAQISKLLSRQATSPTTPFRAVMNELRGAIGDPDRQRKILQRASEMALASGSKVELLEVNAELNSFKRRYGS